MKPHFSPDTSLLPIPTAIVTYRSASGLLQMVAATWVGIACSGHSTLVVGLKRRGYPPEKLGPEGIFAVNLPSSESSLPFMEPSGWPDASFTLIEGELSGVPLIAECPVRIECRRGRFRSSFERDLLKGEVMIVHRNGTVLDHPRAAELCRLNLFAEPGASPEPASSGKIPT